MNSSYIIRFIRLLMAARRTRIQQKFVGSPPSEGTLPCELNPTPVQQYFLCTIIILNSTCIVKRGHEAGLF